LPGRTTNTFASGLVRVDQSYAIPTANIQSVRTSSFQLGSEITGDTYPAVDGLYLYPDAQEVRKEYGITEMIASYYGRTRTDVPPPTVIEQIFYIGSVQVSVNNLFFEFVVPVDEIASFRDKYSFETPLTEPNFMSYDYDGTGSVKAPFTKSSFSNSFQDYYNLETKFGTALINFGTPKILVTGQQNYGKFVELQVTYNR
jgi:hypothetical protein